MSTVANVASNHCHCLFIIWSWKQNAIKSIFDLKDTRVSELVIQKIIGRQLNVSKSRWDLYTVKYIRRTEITCTSRQAVGWPGGRAGLLENISSQLINYDTFLYFIYCLWPLPLLHCPLHPPASANHLTAWTHITQILVLPGHNAGHNHSLIPTVLGLREIL